MSACFARLKTPVQTSVLSPPKLKQKQNTGHRDRKFEALGSVFTTTTKKKKKKTNKKRKTSNA
jgi:hypothetical protein